MKRVKLDNKLPVSPSLSTESIFAPAFNNNLQDSELPENREIKYFITQPSIYGVIIYFLLCHESLNY